MKKEKVVLTTEQKRKLCDEKSMTQIKELLEKSGCFEKRNQTA